MSNTSPDKKNSLLAKVTTAVVQITALVAALTALVLAVPALNDGARSAWRSLTGSPEKMRDPKKNDASVSDGTGSKPGAPPVAPPTRPDDAAVLAAINRVLEKKVQFRLGDKFNSMGDTVTRKHLNNGILAGDFNYIEYSSNDNDETTIAVYSDSNFFIKAISVWNSADAKQRILRSMYSDMLRSWNDLDPLNLVSEIIHQPNPYGDDRIRRETDKIRSLGPVKYTYEYTDQFDKGKDKYAERESFFIALKQ
jgi:hypothetical protein